MNNYILKYMWGMITYPHPTLEHIIQNKISGPRLNIKTALSTYGDFHVKDKTAARTSYL